MNVLITGAGGFIGQALAAALVEEDKAASIILTDVIEPSAPKSATDVIRCVKADLTSRDVCDSLLTEHLTHVFLLHGIMSGAAEADLELGIKVNVDATRQIFDTLRKVNAGVRVIFTSTTAVYGPPPTPGSLLTEANTPAPGSSYGAQKLISEVLLNDYSRRGLLDGRIVRLPTVIEHMSYSNPISVLICHPLGTCETWKPHRRCFFVCLWHVPRTPERREKYITSIKGTFHVGLLPTHHCKELNACSRLASRSIWWWVPCGELTRHLCFDP